MQDPIHNMLRALWSPLATEQVTQDMLGSQPGEPGTSQQVLDHTREHSSSQAVDAHPHGGYPHEGPLSEIGNPEGPEHRLERGGPAGHQGGGDSEAALPGGTLNNTNLGRVQGADADEPPPKTLSSARVDGSTGPSQA